MPTSVNPLSRVAFIACSLLVASACGGPAAVSYTSAAPGAGPATWSFDQDAVGGLPQAAESFSGQWAVRAETDAPSKPNALCQTASATYPSIVLSSIVYADAVITVRFKPISGREDQAAGIIFRVQDKDNYYILRANALESNVSFFKYVGGSRSGIKEGGTKVVAGQWQELRVESSGDRLRGFINGQLVVEAQDATFKAGRVGLWTKADSTTCFDDFSVKPAS
jgi:3-keto-disaccharide hydrolase